MAGHNFEVVIAGGGVIGSAIAYFLAEDPAFAGRILVVEPDPAYQEGSTARSVGSIRQQFSTPENIEMSLFAADFLRDAGAHLAVDGEAPELGFSERGYLFLTGPEGLPRLRENQALQARLGADNRLLSAEELAARFPWINVDGLAGGCLGLSKEGWLDPYALLQAFRRKARSLGVAYRHDRVTRLELSRGRVARVRFRSGGGASCDWFVNATGPRAAEVAAMADIELPVRPRKRQVFAFDSPAELPGCPLVIDPSGLYVRPEVTGYICGIAPPPEGDPDCLDLEVDHRQFEDTIWPLLAEAVENVCSEAGLGVRS